MDDINQSKPVAGQRTSRLVIAMYVMQALLVLIAAGALLAQLLSSPQGVPLPGGGNGDAVRER